MDEITYPFPKFNGCTVEVSEWMSNFIPHRAPGPCCNLDAYTRVDDHLFLHDNIIRYSGPGNRRQYCLGSIRHCTLLSQKIPDELFVSDHDKYQQLA